MNIPVKFSRQRADQLLGQLFRGESIAPATPGDWTADDLLSVAGACVLVALSAGPKSFANKDIPRREHREHQEAATESFSNGVFAAIKLYADLTGRVALESSGGDEVYSTEFEDHVHALADMIGDIEWTEEFLSGLKPDQSN